MELHRVHSVKQTAMAATSLPLELQQQIFSCLDAKSFYAARSVCRYWHFASQDSVTLEKQLRKLPILPQPNARQSTAGELLKLFNDASHTLMLGMQVKREPGSSASVEAPRQQSFQSGPRICATTNGSRTVTLNDRQIALYDTSVTPSKLISTRPINDLKETVGSGPWLKISPPANHDLALSSDGTLLAIAQERTIQIYDLLADADSFTVNQYITSASGHYICGLDFEQNDHVLRVQLSGKGAVLYCGAPPEDSESKATANLDHWKSKRGLRHTLLDTHVISLPEEDNSSDQTARLSGLQLLKPFHSGYLFAAQRHGGGNSSHYILGHVRTSAPDNTTALVAEPSSVTVLSRLESFLSAWDYTLHCLKNAETGFGLWENMPSAHEHHPSFALASQANLLILAENDKKRVRPTPLAQLYAYRIPTEAQMATTITTNIRQREGKWDSLATFLDRLEANQGERQRRISMKHDDFEEQAAKPEFKTGHVPICLGTVEGKLTDMKFEHDAVTGDQGRKHIFTVATDDTTRTWELLEF
ncbi:hypothetical protein Q7P37_001144 [Cladosporium fusiforme]